MKRFLLLEIIFVLSLSRPALAQQESKLELTDFKLQSSVIIKEDGAQLSTADYHSRNYWHPVKVPGTVLAGLVANGVYPSPYFGLNNMRIPDANDSTNKAYDLSKYSHLPNTDNPWKDPYWYRTEFELPGSYAGKRVWLHFKGINYRAEVWLNGQQVADSTDMVGMFHEYRFDVTELANRDRTNYLAVKIYPLDYPGLPSPAQLEALGPFYPNGGPTGDIGKNVAMLCSVGWDWMPAVRDREMGIWQPVYLNSSGPVTVDEPHVTTELPDLSDTTRAGINLGLRLANHSSKTQNGELIFTIRPENFSGDVIQFSRDQKLRGGETKILNMTYDDIDPLEIENPRLWWPNGYGRPNLYHLEVRYIANGKVSQIRQVTFGIRTVSTEVKDVNGWARRDFYLNGKNIKLTGGAWVPDLMLQRDSLRYVQEMSLIENANLNTVRIWGGGIAPPDEFYEQADRHGLMVWQDFWITGDTQGEFKGSPDWPLQGQVFIDNMKSTIKRVRNHPSLIVWTGGNEGHARRELYEAMRQGVAELDGDRPFIPSSSGFAKLPEGWNGSWPDNQKSGVYSGGPYSWQTPETYYEKVENGKDWVWKDEVGMPSQPAFGSLPKIVPNLVPDTTKPFPLNDIWGYHDAASGNGKYETYYQAVNERYGTTRNFEDYSDKTQLLNADGYRAIFESVGSKLSQTGGVLLWKLNAAFPSVIWQIYDWYLNPNTGYYFTKRAVEPLHVQLNLDDSTVAVVNRRFKDKQNLTARVRLYDESMQSQEEQAHTVDAAANQATEVLSLASGLKAADRLTFVELILENEQGGVVSHNVYWQAPGDDFTAVNDLPQAELKVVSVVPVTGKKQRWRVELRNPGNRLAFFVHPRITNSRGEELLPSYWSDNYISIAPGETRMLEVSLRDAPELNEKRYLNIEGWNVKPQKMVLQ